MTSNVGDLKVRSLPLDVQGTPEKKQNSLSDAAWKKSGKVILSCSRDRAGVAGKRKGIPKVG